MHENVFLKIGTVPITGIVLEAPGGRRAQKCTEGFHKKGSQAGSAARADWARVWEWSCARHTPLVSPSHPRLEELRQELGRFGGANRMPLSQHRPQGPTQFSGRREEEL